MSDRQKEFAGVISAILITFGSFVNSVPRNFLSDLVQSYEFRSYDSRMKARASFVKSSIDDVILIDIDLNLYKRWGIITTGRTPTMASLLMWSHLGIPMRLYLILFLIEVFL